MTDFLTIPQHRVTLSGNSTSAGAGFALVSSGTMTLAGGNNITLSQNGNAVTISGAAAGGAQTAISGLANSQTTYTSGSVTLSELGAITIRSTTGQHFQFSVNPQSTQTQGVLSIGVSTGGNTAGDTTVNTGSRFVLVASGNATASEATAAGASTVTISVGTQTQQTQGILSAGVSTGGNTAGDTTVNTGSRLVLAGIGNISLSQATAAGASTISISGSQSVQTQGNLSVGVSTGGNTSGDTTVNTGSRFVLAGGNNITLSQSTAAGATTVTVSAGAGATFSGGMSTIGNTSGDTGYATQRLNLAGGNNITLSGSTNAGSMTITISAPNLGAGAFSGGVSTGGNTAGSTGVTGTRMVFVGTNNISLSQSTDANGGTISINNTASNFSAGVSTMGNTAGDTGVTGTRLVLVGDTSGHLTLSQATDANGATISFVHGPRIGMFNNIVAAGDSGAEPRRSADISPSQALVHVYPLVHTPLGGPFPGLLTCNTFYFRISLSGSTGTMSQVFTSSFSFGIYTSNGSTLSLLNSCSTAISFGGAATNNSTAFAGNRYLTIGTGQWSSLPVFYPGSVYFIATNYRTSGVSNQSFTIFGDALWASASVSHSGTIGVATVNATSLGLHPWIGQYATASNFFPVSIEGSQLNKQLLRASFLPWVIMNEDNPQSF